MRRKTKNTEVPPFSLKNDSARQRWELFHRAIAQAKQSNLDALEQGEAAVDERNCSTPLLSIVR